MQHLSARSAFIQNCHLSSVIIEILPRPPPPNTQPVAYANSTRRIRQFNASNVPIQRVASSLSTGRK